jgi:hypothetical protein
MANGWQDSMIPFPCCRSTISAPDCIDSGPPRSHRWWVRRGSIFSEILGRASQLKSRSAVKSFGRFAAVDANGVSHHQAVEELVSTSLVTTENLAKIVPVAE